MFVQDVRNCANKVRGEDTRARGWMDEMDDRRHGMDDASRARTSARDATREGARGRAYS